MLRNLNYAFKFVQGWSLNDFQNWYLTFMNHFKVIFSISNNVDFNSENCEEAKRSLKLIRYKKSALLIRVLYETHKKCITACGS